MLPILAAASAIDKLASTATSAWKHLGGSKHADGKAGTSPSFASLLNGQDVGQSDQAQTAASTMTSALASHSSSKQKIDRVA